MNELEIESGLSERRFVFHRMDDGRVRVEMFDDCRLFADPIYSVWLIDFVLANPRAQDDAGCMFEFSSEPGNMHLDCIPLYITNEDIVLLREWLND